MNKQNEEETYSGDGDADVDAGPLDGDQTKHGLTLQTIVETMADPEFTTEQLPELWQQAVEQRGGRCVPELRDRWQHGIDGMSRRCTTYLQLVKLGAVVDGMPVGAWYDSGLFAEQARRLVGQATPEQLIQTLETAMQHPQTMRLVGNHILSWATAEQLTGPVIEQLGWDDRLADTATRPEPGPRDRWRHIREHIQQDLLDDSSNAWVVLCGIAEPGTRIGIIAELAIAIEPDNRPVRNET